MHCLVHATMTYLILITVVALGMFSVPWGTILALVVMELLLHFVIDAWKAQLCKSPPTKPAFWIALGADQLLHIVTGKQIGRAHV